MSTWTALFEVEPDPPQVELPALTGSEKQVAWATAIRAGKLKHCADHLRQWRLLIERQEQAGRTDAAERERAGYRAALDILAILEAQTSAGFFIDRRDNTAAELLALAEAKPGNSFGGAR